MKRNTALFFVIFCLYYCEYVICIDNKQIYQNLRKNIASIKESCGQICDQTIKGTSTGKYFEFIQKNVDCPAIFKNSDIDKVSEFKDPPMKIPKWLIPDFTYGGKVPISSHYRDDSTRNDKFQGINSNYWTTENGDWTPANAIREKMILNNTYVGPYGPKHTKDVIDFMKNHLKVKDKEILIIGSWRPWLEIIALVNGAKEVTSTDYQKIYCDRPNLKLMTTYEFNEKYLNGELPQYDVVISISSVEHSGLGRYGDSLNPWGDVIAMAKAWCVTKPGGKALIGFPSGPFDRIEFNANRLYGPIMTPHIFANWNVEHTNLDLTQFDESCTYCYEPLYILSKVE